MDGNNSLKRVARKRTVDDRELDNDYFLSSNFVNLFADEVKPKPGSNPRLDGRHVEDPESGDPTDGVKIDHACADRWKAAMADVVRRLWAIFHETGVFAAACRHGFILWLIDMIRSGEL